MKKILVLGASGMAGHMIYTVLGETKNYEIKDAETSPPSRYNSGSIILAMENAGKLIEEEELREQIKGAGIGTSATRAEILKKLNIKYTILPNNQDDQISILKKFFMNN